MAKLKKFGLLVLAVVLILLLLFGLVIYLPQRHFAHIEKPFVPDYAHVELTEDTDYETIFLQTGLGKSAVDKLISEDNFKSVLKAQNLFFEKPDVVCTPIFSWFTREDMLGESESPDFADLRAGDVLVTLSTHSFGWRHGHAALVVDEYTVLECQQIGYKVATEGIYHWQNYSEFAVLRPKGITAEEGEQVADFALKHLVGKPYRLTSGIFGPKAPDIEKESSGFYCTNLIWYIWNNFGIDLDSDGGKIVTGYDLLHSDKFEVVQIYGIDPREFI